MTYTQLINYPAGISFKAADSLDHNLHSTILVKETRIDISNVIYHSPVEGLGRFQ